MNRRSFLNSLAVLGTAFVIRPSAHGEAENDLKHASKANPFVNSLGMRFVPVAGAGVLFSVWHTRVQDFEAFASATGRGRRRPSFFQLQGPTHPVVNMSKEDALAFCAWLTAKERKEGRLTKGQNYRLPTDWEWSVAVGLNEAPGGGPAEKDGVIKGVYPWGKQYPPPMGVGNFNQALRVDDYEFTSPVGTFPANALGLHDMGGNALQWCEDEWYGEGKKYALLRGSSWGYSQPDWLLSSYRFGTDISPTNRHETFGFRCVLEGAEAQ
ncbi:MAG: SUMF1/EgtB/PvdO family nonheme iron enzyme [Limisphaerales bacterium]